MIGPKNEASISSIRPPVLTSPTLVTLAQKMRSELRILSHQLLSPLPLYEKISELPRQFKIAKTFQKKKLNIFENRRFLIIEKRYSLKSPILKYFFLKFPIF